MQKACGEENTIIEAILENNSIRYVVNGSDYGVAFTNLTGDLYPAFEIQDSNASFEFI